MSFLSAEFIIQLLIAATSAGGISAGFNAWRDKRKADAEAGKEDASAADIIESAAGRSVTRLEAQLQRVDDELDAERDERRNAQREVRTLRRVNEVLLQNQREHAAWDREVIEVLRANNIVIRTPPVLHIPSDTEEGLRS